MLQHLMGVIRLGEPVTLTLTISLNPHDQYVLGLLEFTHHKFVVKAPFSFSNLYVITPSNEHVVDV